MFARSAVNRRGVNVARRVRNILIGVLALYFTILGGTALTSIALWPGIVHRVLLTVLLGGWLVGMVVRRRSFPTTPLDGPLLVYFLVYLLATIFGLDPRVSLEQLWDLGVHTLLFYLLVDVMRTYRPEVVLKPMFFASAVVILVGFMHFTAWYFGLLFFERGWFEIGGLRDPIPPVAYRAHVGALGATALAGYMAVWIPVGLAWAVATRSKQTRRAMILWFAGALAMLGLTLSRGGVLSLGVSLLVFGTLFLFGSSRWRDDLAALVGRGWVRLGLAVLAPVVAAALALGVMRLGSLREQLTGASPMGGDMKRLDLWRSAWETGLGHPLTGVGPHGFGRALRLVRNPLLAQDNLFRPDNFPLFVWAEAGLLGVLALVWLAVAVVRVGMRRWRLAEGPERVRVAGVCAGLLGFTAHNLVDALAILPNLLPVYVFVAYLVVPLGDDKKTVGRGRRLLPVGLALVLAVSMVGWVVSYRAYAYSRQAVRQAYAGDMESALETIDAAQRIDPTLGLYAAQRAWFLGEIAVNDEAVLPEALAAYREAFRFEGTYDVQRVNYAALLKRSGEVARAVEEMQRAVEIYPLDPRNALWMGEYAEIMGDEARARAGYEQALEGNAAWATSAYWEETALRQDVRDGLLRAWGVEDVSLDQLRRVDGDCLPFLGGGEGGEDPRLGRRCEAEVALHLEDDPAAALVVLSRGLAADRTDPVLYALRAEALFRLGGAEQAERDARIAVFLRQRRGYLILGRLAEAEGDLDAAASAYARGGPVMVLRQEWSLSVYGREGVFPLLPDLRSPGPEPSELESLEGLARVYEKQGRPQAAEDVYRTIRSLAPYDAPQS